jgi:hypothetical protein
MRSAGPKALAARPHHVARLSLHLSGADQSSDNDPAARPTAPRSPAARRNAARIESRNMGSMELEAT